MLQIPIINTSKNVLPFYATEKAAGMDIMAAIEEPITLQSLERVLVPTGLYIALPDGYEAQIRPRSGLAIKHGVTLLNSPGTIDADYRGEIKVILVNLSKEPYTIEPGERIAQMIITKYEKVTWLLTDKLPQTQRDTGGFGHTGK
ncbi:MAG: dUTP diphosphatase [Bacteroidia bacterium]|nr:dUTP diphosphatase [Bacteroidia bacterium]MDW8347539.1 dUTP diphosphatase [Bacteroidia bacterium]